MIKILNKLFKKEEPQKLAIVEAKEQEPRHMHTWVLSAQTYAPPVSLNIDKSTFGDTEFLEKASFGVTTILWECDKCQETKKVEMLGSDNDTLEDLVKKVKMTGPQFVERNGETFVFNKWNPASNIPGTIPIR